MADVAELGEQAARFAQLTGRVDPDTIAGWRGAIADLELQGDLEEAAGALAGGRPGEAIALIETLADRLEARSPDAARERLVYGSAVAVRLQQRDVEQLMVGIEGFLGGAQGPSTAIWEETAQGRLCFEAVVATVAPLAGLDVEAALEYTRIFVANFPSISRPLGDVDERATTWIAQILDVGATRTTLRLLLSDLARTWDPQAPRAATEVRGWAERPIPADPTQDVLWMRALHRFARTQV